MGIFRVYLRNFQQEVIEKTNTPNAKAAIAVFENLVDRTELDGSELAAVLSLDNKQIAFHRFDRQAGDSDYWRGRIDEIKIPGTRVGVPAKMEEGRRRNVYIDDASWALAVSLGNGNASEGIRIALAYKKMGLEK